MIDRKSWDNKHINILNQLNQDIERFIRLSIESSFNIEKWSPLSNGFETIKCWEIKDCRKEECPAYNDKNCRCWLKVGTLCGGKVQGEFATKYNTCLECEVFKTISEEPLRLLYENINTLIFHLNTRALNFRILP